MSFRRVGHRQCPRCGFWFEKSVKHCPTDGVKLGRRRKPRWEMTPERIKRVHAIALGRKGLSYEDYKLRLRQYGVDSSKDMDEKTFKRFMHHLKALPDRPRRSA
ncbi:hypothetical protein [Natronospira bacteriovora]|uniref:Uncharacterized protein n=1 Tax=Natronospira bacteriovora TaxID=3069753 RepID=A0ABU0W5J0_9GAMM|nr:hypothetical protein [Natronospira sp. AB-CW4]MDQ2069279.1 hypothetical protein [Natronospira sp. AB-CW4]